MDKKIIAIKLSDSSESILASAPLAAALKMKNPNSKVCLIFKDKAPEIAAIIPHIDIIDNQNTELSFNEIYDISDEQWNEAGYTEVTDWRAYLLALPKISMGNPYHTIDLYRKLANIELTDVNYELLAPVIIDKDIQEAIQVGDGALKIALCVSSLSKNALQAAAEAISKLPFPTVTYLLGTIKDRRVSSNINFGNSTMSIDLCGRSSVSGNAEMLRSSDICICGQGNSALISSGYGTFTLCIDEDRFKGPLNYPYGHGHLVFQKTDSSEFYSSLQTLLAETIENAIVGNGGTVPTLEQWQNFYDNKINSYYSKIRVMGTQRVETLLGEDASFTELHLRPLLYMGAEAADIIQTFYRLTWEHSLSGRIIATHDLEILHADAVSTICQYLKPFEQLFELANFGKVYSGYIAGNLETGDISKAKTNSNKLQEIDELIHTLGTSHPALSPLCAFHEKRQMLLPDQNPIVLAKEMSELFVGLQSRVLAILDLEKSILETAFRAEKSILETPELKAESDG